MIAFTMVGLMTILFMALFNYAAVKKAFREHRWWRLLADVLIASMLAGVISFRICEWIVESWLTPDQTEIWEPHEPYVPVSLESNHAEQ